MPIPKKPTGKHPGGRPTKYDSKYCDEIIEFFGAEPSEEREVTITMKNGSTITKTEMVANRLPFFSAFARKIKVNTDTMNEWCSVYPEFSEAYKSAKELQKEFLIENGISGLYNPAFAIFTAKNITDMRDQQEIKHSGNAGFILNISEVGSRSQEPTTDVQADGSLEMPA